jgi:adenine deaminase
MFTLRSRCCRRPGSPTLSYRTELRPVVCDPHEIANVLGVEGIRHMLDISEELDLSVFMMAPSCVPTSSIETSGAELGVEDIVALTEHPRVLGLAEVMNFPGVLAGSTDVLDKLRALARRERLDAILIPRAPTPEPRDR